MSRANPCIRITNLCARITKPCARITNSCARFSNPCARFGNPCARLSKSCARLSNSCALFSNPCARIFHRCARITSSAILKMPAGALHIICITTRQFQRPDGLVPCSKYLADCKCKVTTLPQWSRKTPADDDPLKQTTCGFSAATELQGNRSGRSGPLVQGGVHDKVYTKAGLSIC